MGSDNICNDSKTRRIHPQLTSQSVYPSPVQRNRTRETQSTRGKGDERKGRQRGKVFFCVNGTTSWWYRLNVSCRFVYCDPFWTRLVPPYKMTQLPQQPALLCCSLLYPGPPPAPPLPPLCIGPPPGEVEPPAWSLLYRRISRTKL